MMLLLYRHFQMNQTHRLYTDMLYMYNEADLSCIHVDGAYNST